MSHCFFEHPLHNMKIRAASSLDENLPIQYAYPRLSLSVNTIRGRLNALEKHHFRHRPEAEFENKRRILVGRDLTVTSTSDMLKDLSDERINEITEDMNEVQKKTHLLPRESFQQQLFSIILFPAPQQQHLSPNTFYYSRLQDAVPRSL